MTFYFRTFRQALSVVMLFVSSTTIVLAFFMLPSFSRNVIPWLLVSIQTLSFIRALWSITRKSLLNSSQTVASEAIGLFSLFPFHLILALIIATTEFKDKSLPVVYVLLQAFVIGGSIIHIIYTTGLLVVALVTGLAFDKDVWIRDIDSSPSPFPIPILIEFLHLRPSTWLRREGSPNPTSLCRIHCLLPCNCPTKLQTREDAGADPNLRTTKSLPHLLVRVPDAAQQRASISISFEAVR